MSALQFIHVIAGLIVLAEALNKLERCQPCARGLHWQRRLVDALKAAAWALLAMGAGGALATPVLLDLGMHMPKMGMHAEPALAEVLVLAGFAVLIVRTRVKEG